MSEEKVMCEKMEPELLVITKRLRGHNENLSNVAGMMRGATERLGGTIEFPRQDAIDGTGDENHVTAINNEMRRMSIVIDNLRRVADRLNELV